MASEIIMALVGVACTGLSSWITFFLTKRRYNTEVDSNQLDNVNKSFDLYKRMMEDILESQKQATDATIKAQNEKIDALQKENEILRGQVNQLQTQMINFLMGNNLNNLSDIKDKLMPLTDILKVNPPSHE